MLRFDMIFLPLVFYVFVTTVVDRHSSDYDVVIVLGRLCLALIDLVSQDLPLA